jgi:hypothetical protein
LIGLFVATPNDQHEWKYGDLPPRKPETFWDGLLDVVLFFGSIVIWIIAWPVFLMMRIFQLIVSGSKSTGPLSDSEADISGTSDGAIKGEDRFRYRDFDRLESGEVEKDIYLFRAGCLGCVRSVTVLVLVVIMMGTAVAAAYRR